MRAAVTGIILLLTPSLLGVAHSASPALDGGALYRQHKCPICHGADGSVSVRDGYPALAGQNRTYLVNQTVDIRDGVRDNGQARLMRPLILRLTRPEIEAIAEYLSLQ